MPRRFIAGRGAPPRALVRDGLVVCWEEGTLLALDASDGSVRATRKLEGPVLGLDAEGELVLARGEGALRLSLPGLESSEVERASALEETRATDAPDHPEIEPFVTIGTRRFKARLEIRSRVTRHHLEVCDEGHPPRESEIASYTLRSDRLTLARRGARDVFGWVGDADCPLATLYGGGSGRVVALRKRAPEWHEHIVSGSSDLVAHGNCEIEAIVIPEGHADCRSLGLGTLEEEWQGLGRRNAAPPHLERGSALRAIGLSGDLAIAEVVDVAATRGATTLLAKRRTIVALDISGAR